MGRYVPIAVRYGLDPQRRVWPPPNPAGGSPDDRNRLRSAQVSRGFGSFSTIKRVLSMDRKSTRGRHPRRRSAPCVCRARGRVAETRVNPTTAISSTRGDRDGRGTSLDGKKWLSATLIGGRDMRRHACDCGIVRGFQGSRGRISVASALSTGVARGRASVYGTEGQRFESSRARLFACVSAALSVGLTLRNPLVPAGARGRSSTRGPRAGPAELAPRCDSP